MLEFIWECLVVLCSLHSSDIVQLCRYAYRVFRTEKAEIDRRNALIVVLINNHVLVAPILVDDPFLQDLGRFTSIEADNNQMPSYEQRLRCCCTETKKEKD
jgi:hypothetical protein